jgi:N-acyl-D-amino-acid deacylase
MESCTMSPVFLSLLLTLPPGLTLPEMLAEEMAARRGLKVLERGMAAYPQQRQCFSCHHQTLPLVALDEARKAKIPINEELFQSQAKFTHAAFTRQLSSLKSGSGIGGRSFTVGYGLWTLDTVRWPKDETTAAMVTYLLKTQEKEGHWPRQTERPPLSESLVASTVLAGHYMRQFATPGQKEDVEAAVRRAKHWLDHAPRRTQEDFVFRLWGLKLLEGTAEQREAARAAVLARQNADGGWGQTSSMASDAYATGQTLFVLREIGLERDHPAMQRGRRFLRRTQLPDGSWKVETRSPPVQVFFDNGDPHGKHQFISMAATAWAVAALCDPSAKAKRE